MSPALAKTSEKDILTAARRLVRQNGVEGLSMRDVADAVGIRAPSLYKRFDNREALLRAVRDQAQAQFDAHLAAAVKDHSPAQALAKLAGAYRDFARRRPAIYRLLHRPELAPARGNVSGVTIQVVSGLVGTAHADAATRCISAFLHGFVSMEMDGLYSGPGSASADEAFAYSVYVILQGLVNSADSGGGQS
jgi:AcrR family transcriptional regulator